MTQNAGRGPNVSFVFQRLDNLGTIVHVDPRLASQYPDDGTAELERRVKVESTMVKVFGKTIQTPQPGLFNRVRKGVSDLIDSVAQQPPPPEIDGPVVITDGDAFVVEFPLDNIKDSAGRRSGLLLFGYRASKYTYSTELVRLDDFLKRKDVAGGRAFEAERDRLRLALEALQNSVLRDNQRRPVLATTLDSRAASNATPPDAAETQLGDTRIIDVDSTKPQQRVVDERGPCSPGEAASFVEQSFEPSSGIQTPPVDLLHADRDPSAKAEKPSPGPVLG